MTTPWREKTDADLAQEAYSGHTSQGAVVEAIRRLRVAVENSDQSMTALTEKIKSLTGWLLWITLAIGMLTAVQVLVALKVISR